MSTTEINSKDLQQAARNGDLESVKKLIPISDPKFQESLALGWAAENGHLDVVRELIPVSDPKADASWAIRVAAGEGHLEVVKALMPFSDLSAVKTGRNTVLEEAAQFGQIEVVRELLPVSNPMLNESYALQLAASRGNLDVVRELIPVSDPKAENSYALTWAAIRGHVDVVHELLPVSDFNDLPAALEESTSEEVRLEISSYITKCELNAALNRSPQDLAQAAISGDQESIKQCMVNADRSVLLDAIEIVATTAEGEPKHSGLTALAQEASNDTLKIATIQANGRGDADTLKAISDVVEARSEQISQQQIQLAVENPVRQRSQARKM